MASFKKRLATAAAAAGLTVALGGCMGDYGYGGIGYASDYYGGYGPGYGYGYGPSFAYGGGYGGWYDDYYYPGYGVYVFDRGGRRSQWNDGQRRYWEGHRQGRPGDGRQGYARVDRGPGAQGYAPRGSWRGNRQASQVPGATSGVVPGANAASTGRPVRQGFSGGAWRGQGAGAIQRGSGQGRMTGGGFGGGGMGRGGGGRHH
jgi:hypothetical protein